MNSIIVGHTLIEYDNNNIRIKDSYMITDRDEMKSILRYFIKQVNYDSKRKLNSYVREWVVHNRFYNMNVLINRTKDTDLEQKQKWYMWLFYLIFSI